VLEAFRLVPSF